MSLRAKTTEEKIKDLNKKRLKLLQQQVKMQEKQIKSIRRINQKKMFRNVVEKMAAKPVSRTSFNDKAFGNGYIQSMMGRRRR